MRSRLRRGNRAGHCETVFEKRPVERFSVEGHEHRPFFHPFREFLKQGIFLGEIAHQELLDLQSPGIPPGQSDEKRVRAGSTGEAGRFCVEEKLFRRIVENRAGLVGCAFVSRPREKFQRDWRWLDRLRGGKPVSNREVFAKMISCYAGPEQLAKYVSFAWSVERSFFCACGSGSRRLQCGQTRELVSHLRHLRTQPVEDCDSRLFGAWREFARGAYTRRATLFAFAGRNQLARFLHQQIVSAKEGLGKADP